MLSSPESASWTAFRIFLPRMVAADEVLDDAADELADEVADVVADAR